MTQSNSGARSLSFVWLAIFAASVALLGGSSRADPAQLIILRPLAVLFLIPALYLLRWDDMREIRFPVLLLGAFCLWMALQLVPLPPAIWQALPGREPIAAIDTLLGMDGQWRALSLAPARGWNSLASLSIPAAALLLALMARAGMRTLLLLIAAIGVFDALLGLVQMLDGASSALYFYRYSNRGSPIGVFANENHSAVFSACVLLVIARLWFDTRKRGGGGPLRVLFPAAFVLVLLAGIVSGSRAGFVATFIALLGTVLMTFSVYRQGLNSKRRPSPNGGRDTPSYWILIFIGGVALALPGLFFAFENIPALSDILAKDAFQDLRWKLWPTLQIMVVTYWPVGSGIGSFEQVYHIFEPDNLLRSSYLNQAHNDWVQFIIEGGLPAAAILLGLIFCLVRGLWVLGRSGSNVTARRIFWLAIFSIIAFASAFDYPLRTPVLQVVGIWLLLAFLLDRGYGTTSGKLRTV